MVEVHLGYGETFERDSKPDICQRLTRLKILQRFELFVWDRSADSRRGTVEPSETRSTPEQGTKFLLSKYEPSHPTQVPRDVLSCRDRPGGNDQPRTRYHRHLVNPREGTVYTSPFTFIYTSRVVSATTYPSEGFTVASANDRRCISPDERSWCRKTEPKRETRVDARTKGFTTLHYTFEMDRGLWRECLDGGTDLGR